MKKQTKRKQSLLSKVFVAICEQIGSFINQTLTDKEKEKVPQSPVNKTPYWKELQKHPRH